VSARVSFYCGGNTQISSVFEDEAVALIEAKLREGEDMWLSTSGDGNRTFLRFANIAAVRFEPCVSDNSQRERDNDV